MLGPLLFVIFTNDLPEQVKSEIFQFADDTKIFRQIKGPDDHNIFEEDINTMLSWTDKWQRIHEMHDTLLTLKNRSVMDHFKTVL